MSSYLVVQGHVDRVDANASSVGHVHRVGAGNHGSRRRTKRSSSRTGGSERVGGSALVASVVLLRRDIEDLRGDAVVNHTELGGLLVHYCDVLGEGGGGCYQHQRQHCHHGHQLLHFYPPLCPNSLIYPSTRVLLFLACSFL